MKASDRNSENNARELIHLERWCIIGLSYITLLAYIVSDPDAEIVE